MRPWLLFALLTGLPAWATEFEQSVDRTEVGTEDTFRLTVTLSDPPEGASVRFPESDDFEVLSRSSSTQMSYRMTGGAGVISRVQTWTLVMRANREGTLTIPPSSLTARGLKPLKTQPIQMKVKRGQLAPSSPPPRSFPSIPSLPDGLEDFGFPDMKIPRNDSDVFMRIFLDKEQVYPGEQAALSVYILSRVDLQQTEALSLPKLNGFWTEDLESPRQLVPEQRIVGGVPYRAYLLKRIALFPLKSGKHTIGAAEADIITGFLFSGHRVHRKSNELELDVKPLPPGAPDGFFAGNVGQWQLSVEAEPREVKLGEPITVRVIAEGRGNLKNLSLPRLSLPPALKVYDPTTTDKTTTLKDRLGGRRTQEYLVTAQQTGRFTLPPLELVTFDPLTDKYETKATAPIELTILAGPGGQAVASDGPKNKLESQGLRPIRHQAEFVPPSPPVWRRAFYWPSVVAPVALFLLVSAVGYARGAMRKTDPLTEKKRQAKHAKSRLAQAEKLKGEDPALFYAELERALKTFLEAKLGEPVGGLTRDRLAERLVELQVPTTTQALVLQGLETCELGRYAPGGAGPSARERALQTVEGAMEGWR